MTYQCIKILLIDLFDRRLKAKAGIFGKAPKPYTPEFDSLFKAWCSDMGLLHEDKEPEFNEYE